MLTRFKAALATVLAVATAVPAFAFALPAHAAITSTVIKGPNSATLYWYASNGKRYVFPNANTFYTWYGDFLNVQNVTESELAAIQLAGNVTYRPGARLVKVESDPKVYAVARYGVLRHVTSEWLASQLYGSDWRSKVQDIPAVFFTNYTIGNPIYNTWDFNVGNEYNGVANPNDNIAGLGTTGSGNTSAYGFTLNASRTSINPGEAVELTVTAYAYPTSNNRIEIYDTRNTSSVIRSCSYASTCTQTVYPQRNGNETTVQYYAVLRDQNGNFITNAYGPVIYFNDSSGQNGILTLTANRSNILSGETVTLTGNYNVSSSNVTGGMGTSGIGYLVIQAKTESNQYVNISGFGNLQVVKSHTPTVTTIYRFAMYAAQSHGPAVLAGTSNEVTVYVSGSTTNGTTSNTQITGLDLVANPTSLASGSYLRLTANAYNTGYNWNYTGNRLEIRDLRTQNVVKTCYDQSWCVAELYPTRNGSESSVSYGVRFYDRNGSFIREATSQTVAFTDSGSTANQNTTNYGALTGTTDLYIAPTAARNTQIYVTASIANANVPTRDLVIRISENGSVIGTCNGVAVCSVARAIGNGPVHSTIRVEFGTVSQMAQLVRTIALNVN